MSDKQLANKSTTEIAEIDKDTYSALKNSVFPGAKDESIQMVLAYCKARKLDPLQKPVHIVPMYVKDAGSDQGRMRDVVMPGIALYRIQAQRSGQYAGQSDPDFGEDVSETLSGVRVTYPKWCKITVMKQMPNGQIVEFSAKEFWKENYATKGKESEPNAMWKKRPYAQLAKCAEAQALRKAFPDVIDHTPTAEEMEGKDFDHHYQGKAAELNKSFNLYEGNAINVETGEILQASSTDNFENSPIQEAPKSDCPYTFEEIKDSMGKASTIQAVNDLASIISQLQISKEQHSELSKLYREKLKELK